MKAQNASSEERGLDHRRRTIRNIGYRSMCARTSPIRTFVSYRRCRAIMQLSQKGLQMSSLHTPLDSSSGVVISSVFTFVIVCAHLQNGEIVFFTSYNIIKMSRRHRRKIKMRFSLLVFFIQWIMVDAKKPLYRVLERLKHEIRNVEYGGVEGRKTEKQIKHF